MSTPKMALLGLWMVVIVVALLPAAGMLATFARAFIGLLVVGHAVECVVYLSRLRQQPGGLGAQLLQTMVFGVFHLRELPRA